MMKLYGVFLQEMMEVKEKLANQGKAITELEKCWCANEKKIRLVISGGRDPLRKQPTSKMMQKGNDQPSTSWM